MLSFIMSLQSRLIFGPCRRERNCAQRDSRYYSVYQSLHHQLGEVLERGSFPQRSEQLCTTENCSHDMVYPFGVVQHAMLFGPRALGSPIFFTPSVPPLFFHVPHRRLSFEACALSNFWPFTHFYARSQVCLLQIRGEVLRLSVVSKFEAVHHRSALCASPRASSPSEPTGKEGREMGRRRQVIEDQRYSYS